MPTLRGHPTSPAGERFADELVDVMAAGTSGTAATGRRKRYGLGV